ncbi:uromodulin-like [Mixophyes fleayi]|uniref:uromodulin-like n=1 Tax=Mixophyes fleayi TaxID=3061075 RepID=UPI003F4D8664
MGTNDCCSLVSGWYWDPALQCCTDVINCSPSCMSDEYCDTASGPPTCLCDKTMYMGTTIAALKPTVSCDGGAMSLSISVCQLEQLGYDYRTSHLIDNSSLCTFTYNQVINNVNMWLIETRSAVGWCGNILTMNSSHVTYTNTEYFQPMGVTSSGDLAVNLSCSYALFWESQLLLSVQQEDRALTVSEVYVCSDICANIAMNDQFAQPLYVGESLDERSTLFITIYTPFQLWERYHIVLDQFFTSPINDSSTSSQTQIMHQGVVYDSRFEIINNWTPTEAKVSVQTSLFTNQSRSSLFFSARLCDSYTEHCCKLMFLTFLEIPRVLMACDIILIWDQL